MFKPESVVLDEYAYDVSESELAGIMVDARGAEEYMS